MSIKTTDLRPCDNCGGPIAPFFYRLEIKFRQLMVDYSAVNQLGTAAILGGNIGLGAIMSPDRDVLIEMPGYRIDKELWLCINCVLGLDGEPFVIRPTDLMEESEEND